MHTYVDVPFDTAHHPVVSLDVETTGFNPFAGDRIVEIGMVEYLAGERTGRVLHRYVNPKRHVPEEVVRVHGLDDAFLRDKPVFAEVVDEVREFTRGAIVVIQNAPFDLGFINMEFVRCGRADLPCLMVIDTLETSRREGVAARHTLDAMCDRHGIDRQHRKQHGALLDAELLGDVFAAITRGRGPLDIVSPTPISSLLNGGGRSSALQFERIPVALASGLLLLQPTAGELEMHESYLDQMRKGAGGRCVWDNGEIA